MRTRIGFDSRLRRDGLWRGVVRVARHDSSRELLRLDPLSRFRQTATATHFEMLTKAAGLVNTRPSMPPGFGIHKEAPPRVT